MQVNREIKFRAWDKEEKRIINYPELCNLYRYAEMASLDLWLENDFITLMQYTGLKDKNGKEIWEGDIVKYGRYTNTPNAVGFIAFDNELIAFVIKDFRVSQDWYFMGVNKKNLEIIGNIYENPELLETSQEEQLR